MRGFLMSIVTVLALAGCAASEDSDAARDAYANDCVDHLVGRRLVGANVDLEAHRAAISKRWDTSSSTCASGLTN